MGFRARARFDTILGYMQIYFPAKIVWLKSCIFLQLWKFMHRKL